MSDVITRLDQTLSKYIRPLTFPVALRFLKEGEALPPRTKIPTRDIGNPISYCQAVSLARRYGWTLALYKNDQACGVGQVILGYQDEPDFIKNGSLIKPLYTDNDAAAVRTQSSTPKMPEPNTHGMLFAPLDKCTFQPDVILCYGNAAQIVRLIQAAIYKNGGYVESRFAGRGACGGEVVVPILQDRCNVIIPGGGERVFAMAADDELAFAIPYSKVEEIVEGLTATHKAGAARIPTPVAGILNGPHFPVYYHPLEAYCGLREETAPVPNT